MKLSVSSYSFQQYINAGKMTQLDCIAKAKEIGFDAMDFTDLQHEKYSEEEYAHMIAEEANKYEIAIASYTIGANLMQPTDEEVEKEIERVKRKIDIAKILGAPSMRHDVMYSLEKYRSFDLALPELAASVRKITEYGEKVGVKTSVENHGFIAQDSDRVERLFNAVNHKNFGLLVDIGNFTCAGEEPTIAVSRVAPYAVHVHAKDFRIYPACANPIMPHFSTRAGTKLVGAILGTGDVDVETCLRIIKNAGYDGYVALEYEAPMDCIVGIETGYKNLRTVLERIGG